MKDQQDNKNGKKKLASEWFAKATDDELSGQYILKDREGAASTVCFLSQQMAEKYLKGYFEKAIKIKEFVLARLKFK